MNEPETAESGCRHGHADDRPGSPARASGDAGAPAGGRVERGERTAAGARRSSNARWTIRRCDGRGSRWRPRHVTAVTARASRRLAEDAKCPRSRASPRLRGSARFQGRPNRVLDQLIASVKGKRELERGGRGRDAGHRPAPGRPRPVGRALDRRATTRWGCVEKPCRTLAQLRDGGSRVLEPGPCRQASR